MPAAALSVPLRVLSDWTNMCTLVVSTLPFSAQMCVLRPLQINTNPVCSQSCGNIHNGLHNQLLYCGVLMSMSTFVHVYVSQKVARSV
jgi:hypothetical protein